MTSLVVIPLAVSACAFVVLGLVAVHHLHQAAVAYLVAYAFVIGLPLGAMLWSMVCDACGAVWFVPFRRLAEAISASFPILAVLFLPVIACMGDIYPWVFHHPATGSAGVEVSSHDLAQQAYLRPGGFVLRAAICFTSWIVVSECLRSWSLAEPINGRPDWSIRRRALAAMGLLPVVLTVTIAAVDWYMSLEPDWHSSVYGLLQLAGDATAGLAALIILVFLAVRFRLVEPVFHASHYQALGTLLLVGVLMWAYLAFMQLLVIWMADLPDESGWYVMRFAGGWAWLGLAVLLLHFLVPFLLLLSRAVKRSLSALALVSVIVLIAQYADLLWQLAVALQPDALVLMGIEVIAAVAILGAAVGCAAWRTDRRAVLPIGDPDYADGLHYRSQV